MKHTQKTRNVFMAIGILASLALAIGWFVPTNTVEAETKAFSLPRVYSFSFGVTQTGTMFASMHKSREVTTDQISFMFGNTDPTHALLGPGHGAWKYNADKNKVTITTFHTDQDGSSKYWKIVQTLTPDENWNLSGTAKISRYGAIGEGASDVTSYESPSEATVLLD